MLIRLYEFEYDLKEGEEIVIKKQGYHILFGYTVPKGAKALLIVTLKVEYKGD